MMVSWESATHATEEENQNDILSIDAVHFELVKFDDKCPDSVNRFLGTSIVPGQAYCKWLESISGRLNVFYLWTGFHRNGSAS